MQGAAPPVTILKPLCGAEPETYACLRSFCDQSLFGSLFINDWFVPSVRVAAFSGSRCFAFGATIAMRRDVLSHVGGFKSIANQLADD